MPDEPAPETNGPTTAWYWPLVRVIVTWSLLTALWIAYAFHSRGIPMDARSWSLAFGGGVFVTIVRMSCSLLILREPPKSLWRRLLAHAGVIVLVCVSFAIWVMTLDWLQATS